MNSVIAGLEWKLENINEEIKYKEGMVQQFKNDLERVSNELNEWKMTKEEIIKAISILERESK